MSSESTEDYSAYIDEIDELLPSFSTSKFKWLCFEISLKLLSSIAIVLFYWRMTMTNAYDEVLLAFSYIFFFLSVIPPCHSRKHLNTSISHDLKKYPWEVLHTLFIIYSFEKNKICRVEHIIWKTNRISPALLLPFWYSVGLFDFRLAGILCVVISISFGIAGQFFALKRFIAEDAVYLLDLST